MSKAITLSDLKKALSPIMEALEAIKFEQGSTNSQVGEMYPMLTNLHIKLDLMEQNIEAPEDEAPAKKKTKKAHKKPVKKTTKKSTKSKKSSEDSDDDSDDEPDKSKTKKRSVKRPPKKGGNSKVDEPIDNSDSGSDNESFEEEKKKPVKKVTKTTKKRTTKAKPKKKERLPNKMEYFNKMFDEDEHYFSTYITDDNVAEIEEKHEDDWEDLEGEALRKARRTAFYHFMKDNHDKQLKLMKESYHETLTKKKPVIASKE